MQVGKIKWEIIMEKLEVKDAEFKENQTEVVRLKVNPHQLWRSGVKIGMAILPARTGPHGDPSHLGRG